MHPGVVRIEFERTAVRGNRFIEPAQLPAGFTQVAMRGGMIRMEDDGLANHIRGEGMAAGLVGDDPEQMKRVGMVWLRDKDLAIERLGFGQAPSPVVLEREIEGL